MTHTIRLRACPDADGVLRIWIEMPGVGPLGRCIQFNIDADGRSDEVTLEWIAERMDAEVKFFGVREPVAA